MVGFLLPVLFCIAVSAAQTLIDIPGVGRLRGKTSLSFFRNRTIYEFQGIPYAKRPMRFMPATKRAAWTGVLNATTFGRVCPQNAAMNTTDTGDLEDCLFLDVYTPQANNVSKLPVLFYIHGGSFVAGSTRKATPGFLLELDIVFVAIQYRLGALGFLNVGMDGIIGNAGLYDQLMALQWVYDNIQYFGGDPKKIAVSGVGAGAMSASLLHLSPLAKGMINRVFMMSGSALSSLAVDLEPIPHSLRIAKLAGCKTNKTLVSCLRSLDPLALVRAYGKYQVEEWKKGRNGIRGVIPVVDGVLLPRKPLDILRSSSFKPLPMMISVVEHEGIPMEETLYQYYLVANNLTEDNRTLKYGIPDLLLSNAGIIDTMDTTCTIATAIEDMYFKPEEFGNYTAMRAGIIDFLGSTFFKGPALRLAQFNTLRGENTFLVANHYSVGNQPYGVVPHGSDQLLLFPQEPKFYKFHDVEMVRNVTNIFGNFITGTISNISWEPYSMERSRYLVIKNSIPFSNHFEKEFTIAEQEGLYK